MFEENHFYYFFPYSVIIFSTNHYFNEPDYNYNEYIIKIENADMFFGIIDGFVYFGRNTCPFCYRFLPLLRDVADEERVQVFYFDTDHFRKYNLLTNDELQDVFANYQITHVPIIIKLVNGKFYDSFTPLFSVGEDDTNIVRESARNFLIQR